MTLLNLTVSISIGGLQSDSQLWWGVRTPRAPQFIDTATNITAISGDSAFLPCTVEHLADRSVTWMRQRDLHILTAGVFTYSADERFRVLHPENTNDWTLQIQYVGSRDGGVYECQVNSDPKISRRVILKVKETTLLDDPEILIDNHQATPSVEIQSPYELFMQEGSVLSLTCVINHLPRQAPRHLVWFHGEQPVDYNSTRGGVSVQTSKHRTRTVSKLSVSSVSADDSGEYTCSPTDMPSFTVVVHVQNGQNQAAVQQKEHNLSNSILRNDALLVFVLALEIIMALSL